MAVKKTQTGFRLSKAAGCVFCQGATLDWKDAENLRRFTSERGKILSRAKTGTCARHQRRLTKAIKRARHVALLPFTTRV